MHTKNNMLQLASRTVLTVSLIAVFGLTALGQDPTGRPTKKPPKKPPTTVKRPPVKPDPEPPTVTLTVMSNAPGAAVLINGNRRGMTDAEGKFQIEKLGLGQYSVELKKDGFRSAVRGFNAGSEAPTIVFKLEPDTDRYAKEFDALIDAGKLTGPESPNAFEVLQKLAAAHPDEPQVPRMRGVLSARLVDLVRPGLTNTIVNWRTITRDEIVRALDACVQALSVKSDDQKVQSQAAYLRGVLAYRDYLTSGAPASEGENGGVASARAELEKAIQLDDSSAMARYYLASVLLVSGDAASAESNFVKVTQLEPRWAIAHVGLGRAYQASGKHKEAIEAFRKALEIDPTLATAQAGLGLARYSKGDTKQGMKDLEKAVQMDQSSGVASYHLGLALAQSKKKKERDLAIEELKKAMQKNPDNLDFLNRDAEVAIAKLQTAKK